MYFNKPIYIGQAILDISKTLTFDFHYNYIIKNYGNKAELLMTDTDSLVYLIQTEDFYLDINKDVKKKFDTSNYPEIHPSGIKTGVNKKVNGVIKDEAGGLIISHFISLSAKLYSLLIRQNEEALKNIPLKKLPFKGKEEERKAKGVKKSVIIKSLTFEDYKKCLFSEEKQMREMNIFRTKNHEVYSTTVNKVALSPNDDKRLVCPNKINTLVLSPLTDEIKEYCVINKNDLFQGRDSPIYKYSEEIQRWYESLLSNS